MLSNFPSHVWAAGEDPSKLNMEAGSQQGEAGVAEADVLEDEEIDLEAYRSSNVSGYKGVYMISADSYEASVWENGHKRRLGRYSTAKEAAYVYARATRPTNPPPSAANKANAPAEEGWEDSGSPHIGKMVRRNLPSETGELAEINGRVTHWMPPGEDPEDDPVLYHVLHADGDEEDLEEFELQAALEAYALWQQQQQPSEDAAVKVISKNDRSGSSCGRYKHKPDCRCHLVVKAPA